MTKTAAKPKPKSRAAKKALSAPPAVAITRRREWRFDLPLTALVEGTLPDGSKFRETAKLENISSGGAYFGLDSGIIIGSKFELLIDLPKEVTKGQRIQLKIGGRAVRLEQKDKDGKKLGVAVRFGREFQFISGTKK